MSQIRVPKPGEFYRHFKNKYYQIIAIAIHSETREQMVVYQALYGDFQTFVRPLDMFASEVDHEKYPQVKQLYRFELISRDELQKGLYEMNQNLSQSIKDTENSSKPLNGTNIERNYVSINIENHHENHEESYDEVPVKNHRDIDKENHDENSEKNQGNNLENNPDNIHNKNNNSDCNQEVHRNEPNLSDSKDISNAQNRISPDVLAFLDADTYQDKLNVLASMKNRLEERTLDTIATAMELYVDEQNIEERYATLIRCLELKNKFENSRNR